MPIVPSLRKDQEVLDSLGRTWHSFGYDLLEYEFHLMVDGKLTGVFQRLTGGEIEVARITHDIVYENGTSTTLFIPGTTSFAPFTLERGFANYGELFRWLMEASNGHIIQARRDGSIVMTRHGEPLLWWNFYRAWPTKLAGFNYNQYADAQKARVSITIAAEQIDYAEYTSSGQAVPVTSGDFQEWFSGS